MSTADGWDFTVPDDDGELLAELRRHGVTAGKRFRLVENPEPDLAPSDDAEAPAGRERFRFAGMLKGAEPDLATNMDRYLAEGFAERNPPQ